MAKQMLAGSKGTKNLGKLSAGKLLALGVLRIAQFQWRTPEMEFSFYGYLLMDGIGRLAISTVFFFLICLHPLLHTECALY